MALRDKLARRAHPYLEPGEQIQAVFLAQSGLSPYWILVSALLVVFTAGYAIVVVTDRSVVVLRSGRMLPTFPKKLHSRGPRAVHLGQPHGLWGSIRLDRKYWVHKRFHKDVAAANAILQQMYPQGAPQPPQYGAPQYNAPAQYGPPPAPPQYGPPAGAPQYGPPAGVPQYGPPPGQPYGAAPPQPPYGAPPRT